MRISYAVFNFMHPAFPTRRSSYLRLLGWLETPPQAFALAHDYLRVTLRAVPASMLSVTLMMASRGAGDAVTPLRFMIFAVVLDIVFNPVLILGLGPFPRLGIAEIGRAHV